MDSDARFFQNLILAIFHLEDAIVRALMALREKCCEISEGQRNRLLDYLETVQRQKKCILNIERHMTVAPRNYQAILQEITRLQALARLIQNDVGDIISQKPTATFPQDESAIN